MDHCRAVDLLIERGTSGEVYNIGGGNEVRNVDLTRRILALTGRPAVADPPGEGPARATTGGTRWTPRRRARSAGRRRSISTRACARPSTGIATTSRGGGRSRSRTRRFARTTRRSTGRRVPDVATSVLVTGAAGFAGSHLVDALAASGAARRRLVAPARPATAHAVAGEVAGRGPARSRAVREAIARHRPSVVYHCAGAAHVGLAVDRIGATFEVNVWARRTCWRQSSATRRDARVVVTSSALVYARSRRQPLDEDSPIGPASPYAVSKLAQDTSSARAAERGLVSSSPVRSTTSDLASPPILSPAASRGRSRASSGAGCRR